MKESCAVAERSSQPERANLENLEILTFTGLDYQTDFQTVWELWSRYPIVEFGGFVGGRSGQSDARRYPAEGEIKWWRGLTRKSEISVAIHLCGRFARAALGDGDTDEVLRLCRGFSRVQINAREYEAGRVAAFAEAVDVPKVILQKRQPFEADWVLPDPKVEYLFDLSGGQGLESLEHWLAPDAREIRSGYAGGLNQANVDQALEFVASHPQRRFWLDMESGVRTANDWLDIGQVAAVCEKVFPEN